MQKENDALQNNYWLSFEQEEKARMFRELEQSSFRGRLADEFSKTCIKEYEKAENQKMKLEIMNELISGLARIYD